MRETEALLRIGRDLEVGYGGFYECSPWTYRVGQQTMRFAVALNLNASIERVAGSDHASSRPVG